MLPDLFATVIPTSSRLDSHVPLRVHLPAVGYRCRSYRYGCHYRIRTPARTYRLITVYTGYSHVPFRSLPATYLVVEFTSVYRVTFTTSPFDHAFTATHTTPRTHAVSCCPRYTLPLLLLPVTCTHLCLHLHASFLPGTLPFSLVQVDLPPAFGCPRFFAYVCPLLFCVTTVIHLVPCDSAPATLPRGVITPILHLLRYTSRSWTVAGYNLRTTFPHYDPC